MVNYTNEELLEVLPPSLRESKELTTKQKVVLGQLVIYNGLEIVKKDGYFYRSNKDLCNDCDIQEKTLIAAVNKLVMLGFIERKSGSRKDGASLYRINLRLITDYCRTPIDDNCNNEIENCSNDYSKQIVEMTHRIKELEITVKQLIERITVIEGKDYSTEVDIDKELDKEKNKNILNNKSLYNIIEETSNSEELEVEESKEYLTESQHVSSENPSEVETSNAEQTTTPTSEDKELMSLVNPYLSKVQLATSILELNTIKAKMVQTANDYINSVSNVSEWVIDDLNERITDYLVARSKEIEEMHSEQITKQLSQYDQYSSCYC